MTHLGTRRRKYCGSILKVCFAIKRKEIKLLEVTIAIIGENTPTKCLKCIKYEKQRKSLI